MQKGEATFLKKKYGRGKKKESNLFFAFSKLLPWATSLKVTLSGIVLYS